MIDTAGSSKEDHSVLYVSSVSEDIIFYFASVFACGMFCMDFYLAERIMSIVRPCMTITMLLIGICLSFMNGCRRRYGFAAFELCFWLIPAAVIYISKGLTLTQMSTASMTAEAAARLLICYPYTWLSDLTGVSAGGFAVMTPIVLTSVFLFGYSYSDPIIRNRQA